MTKRTRKSKIIRRPRLEPNDSPPPRPEAVKHPPAPLARRVPLAEQIRRYTSNRNMAGVFLASLGSDDSRRSVIDGLRRTIRVVDKMADDQRRPMNRRPSRDRQGELLDVVQFPWSAVKYEAMQAIRAELLRSGLSPATINHTLTCVKSVLAVGWQMGIIEESDWRRVKSIKGVRGSREHAGRFIEEEEIRQLYKACEEPTIVAIRDAAVIATLQGGFRRKEVASIELKDVDMKRGQIKVIGKGNKERAVPVPDETLEAIKLWIEVRGNEPGTLFLPCTKIGVLNRRISKETIRQIVIRRTQKAELASMSPHDFRRTYASTLFDKNTDLPVVMALMGHASPTTTVRYDRRGEKSKRRAVNRLSVPFDAKLIGPKQLKEHEPEGE